jgi:subfamily B ATP-binding cassette protein MsbA
MLSSFIKADTESIENKHSCKYVSNLNYDVSQITHMLSSSLLNIFKDSLTLIGLLTVMFIQNWRLSLIAIIMIPIASITAKKLGKRISKITTEAQERSGDLNKYLIDLFKNHKIIKIFQRENFESARSEKFVNKLKEKQIKIFTVFIRATPIMEILTGIMIAILIFYSGKLIMTGQLSINNFFSFLAAMMLAYQPVRSLATINIGIGQGLSAGRRILPIIDTKVKISKNESGKKLLLNNGSIKFKNINLDSLRKEISIVDQNTTLFDDTVLNNIKYAKPTASKDEVVKASELAMCSDFISKLENGFDTMIGENGVKLSGGEKQRLSIARALLKDSKIILLDEATSSLDSDTEEKIQKALAKLTSNKTTIVIAHRLSTILNSDKIYVLDKGSVVAQGKHDQLLNSSNIYKNFYNKQIKNN